MISGGEREGREWLEGVHVGMHCNFTEGKHLRGVREEAMQIWGAQLHLEKPANAQALM
jgi:hypothetical protein